MIVDYFIKMKIEKMTSQQLLYQLCLAALQTTIFDSEITSDEGHRSTTAC